MTSNVLDLLKTNGEAGEVEQDKRTGEAEYQFFVAQAGPFPPKTPVCVLGEEEAKVIAAEIEKLRGALRQICDTFAKAADAAGGNDAT